MAIYHLVRDPHGSLPRALVIRALDDPGPAWMDVPMGRKKKRVDSGFGTVRGAALMALESLWGQRHRGSDARRAARYQDDLRLGGLGVQGGTFHIDLPQDPGAE